ncbi:unnamed protein product [Eretmochelys imbricata]
MANVHMLLENKGRVLFCLILVNVWEAVSGQIRYSIPEEMQKGSSVGNIAKDLGLAITGLSDREVRIVGRGRTQYFTLNIKSGHLYPTERVDREQICGQKQTCLLNFEIIVEDKMKVFGVEVEITDINDNEPRFQEDELEFRISELAAVGTRYSLEGAQDPDLGTNSVQGYYLSSNKHFSLDVQTGADGDKYAELVLERSLDREEQDVHDLILTATDGGDPVRSGTAEIRVIVLDANDNAPVFSQPVYKVSVLENVPVGSLLLTVNTTDPDEAINSEVTYSLRKMKDKASQIFQVDSKTGEISTVGNLDYEEAASYEMEVQAKDVGDLSARSKVLIAVIDINDNAPEITVTSVIKSVSEDSPPGTVIALINLHDRDSGENGEVTCSIPRNIPFRLQKSFDNYYSLVSDRALDREQVSDYNVTITATDRGTPPLSSTTTILVQLSDINDNAPIFNQTSYTLYITENNPRGTSVCSLKANDPDSGENARVTYSITGTQIQEAPLPSSISINSETGALYALRSFDYEQFREIRFQVQAQDGGSPPLSSNVSVTLFILDQNDNSPHILHPSFPTDGSTGVELAPRSSEPGYLVTKVVAVDADSGQNAWLSYQLLKATEPGLFSVGLHSGEIRTARSFADKDALKQSLVVLVKDNGQPPLSATATVTVVVADSIPEILSDLSSLSAPADPQSSLTLYLVIAVASVSCLFFTFILVFLALRLRRWRNSQLFDSSNVTFSGVPVSQFVGIDGVRAFLHSYSHEVSLTTDSRKSQCIQSALNYSNRPIDEKKEGLLIAENLRNNERNDALGPMFCNPSPSTTSHPRKFPTYKAGDDTEAFLENFERACLGYNISTDQYMVELRPQLSGPLAEVAAEMPKEHMNKYELFKSKARVRMGITPEQSRRRFRALRWKPDMSFTRHAYHIVKHWDAWISGASVESPVNLPFLMQMEQFLEGVPEEIERYILDGKPKTVIEAGEIGARWVEVAEKKKTGRSWSGDQKGPPQTTPYYRGPPKAPPTSQRTLQTPYRPATPFSSNPPRPSDPSAGRCFKCNELGHVKANCPKNPNRLQFIAPESHQRSTGPDTSQIPLERRETVSVGGKKVTAWRDTGAQVSAIHASLVDPNLINPEIQVTIQPFKSNSFNLPTAKLPVQYKGWSGMWTFAVYDDYPIPMLLGEDLANHVKQAKRVGMVTRSQAKQAVRPSSVPETSIRTQSEVMDPDPRPMSATAVVDPVPETQTEPVPEPEPAEQPTPDPVPALNPVLATSKPEGPTEPELAAADNPTQEAQPELESQPSAPAESGSQSTETAPSPISLPEGPSLGPQSNEELMSPASREQFQTEQEADESLQRAWTAARSNPPPLNSSNRSRFVVERGLLYKETLSGGHQEDWHPERQLVVPTKYRAKLLSLAHDHPSGHAGVNRTKDRLGGSFHWEGMGKDVSTYVQSCEVCQRVGKPQDQVKAPLQPLPIIEVPFQRVAVDILGPFPKKTARGKQYILTFMDFATRWPEAVALSNTRAKSVCQALADIFARVGWPSDILTDAGTNFLAGTMKNLWEAHGVNHLVATPYHHQTNGMVEKFNGTLGAMIRKFVNEHSNDWDLVLQQLLFAYRAVPHPSLGFSPFELVYGREVKGPLQLVKQQWEGFTPSPGTNILDFVTNLQNTLRTSLAFAKENLQDAQKEQKAWYDKHARERSFKVGDQVMVLRALQAHKMEASWEGPFMVRERLGAVNYLIAFPTSNRKPKVYHINSLKPFYSRELKVCQFTAQGEDDAEWPEGVYYEGKCAGGVEEVNLSMTLGRMQRQQIQELCTSYAPTFSATPGLTERAYHSIDTVFLSKILSERESNWSVTEKECYAIVYALEKLRPYVWGWRFHLQTDHAALKWLHTVKETNKKLLRWSLALQDFDFDIQHISGASNKVADALSRESFPESTG